MSKPEVKTIDVESRETGTNESKRLRENLRIPAVLYGPEVEENFHFSVDELELEELLSVNRTILQEVEVEGETYKTLLKNVDFHPVTDRPIHADFYALSDDHQVVVRVPIHLEGVAEGVTEGGGRVFQPMHIVRIKAYPDDIPSEYTLDITELEIGDSLHVGNLDLEGVESLDDLERTIVTIRPPKSEAMLESALAPQPTAEEEELEEGEELAEGEVPEEGEEGEELEEGEEPEEGEEEETE